jgi:hypothetical protein
MDLILHQENSWQVCQDEPNGIELKQWIWYNYFRQWMNSPLILSPEFMKYVYRKKEILTVENYL